MSIKLIESIREEYLRSFYRAFPMLRCFDRYLLVDICNKEIYVMCRGVAQKVAYFGFDIGDWLVVGDVDELIDTLKDGDWFAVLPPA